MTQSQKIGNNFGKFHGCGSYVIEDRAQDRTIRYKKGIFSVTEEWFVSQFDMHHLIHSKTSLNEICPTSSKMCLQTKKCAYFQVKKGP